MLYTDFLKTITTCPFCDPKDRVLAENDLAFMTYARAPYHAHHVLVMPKRHVVKITELSAEEMAAIDNLVLQAVRALEKAHSKILSVLVRDGEVNESNDKSVSHLHYHVVPDIQIGSKDHQGNERMIMTEAESARTFEELSRLLKR